MIISMFDHRVIHFFVRVSKISISLKIIYKLINAHYIKSLCFIKCYNWQIACECAIIRIKHTHEDKALEKSNWTLCKCTLFMDFHNLKGSIAIIKTFLYSIETLLSLFSWSCFYYWNAIRFMLRFAVNFKLQVHYLVFSLHETCILLQASIMLNIWHND